MGGHPKLKRVYWDLQEFLRMLPAHLSVHLPGAIGQRIRRITYGGVLKHLGKDVVFQPRIRMFCPENISIGSYCNFNSDVIITGGGGVTIGDWVGFGPGVKIWSINHRFDDPDRPWQLQGHERRPVIIEDDVWLGANVFVAPGVTIGKGAIVAAGSVINKKIPPYALVSGNPGRVVGWRKAPAIGNEGAGESRDAIAQ
jgi:acetyltransferase-like isoleucine patch superfamily enzyme